MNVNYTGEDTPGAREDNTADIPRQPAYTPNSANTGILRETVRALPRRMKVPGDVQTDVYASALCVIPLAALVPGIRGHHSNGRAPTLYPPHFAIPLSEHLSIKNDSARSGDLRLYTQVKREKEREGEKEMGKSEKETRRLERQ
ncbi:hypothetical protein WN51_01443 [Melipona quadrifasciata]|uniref:Uncharacterized protein n=1 Tax=Melipona quadrifasciata TaxID=166423 RepID=A0A0N0U4I4_9HYME|nr:hypothetical protein WN51_01443 [Melipona quadrifasciata]